MADGAYNGAYKCPVASATKATDGDLNSGLIRLHILQHAVKAHIFGLAMLEELARHGYRISPGTTLYRLLQGLEHKGCLRPWEVREVRSRRRVFRATPKGQQAITGDKKKIKELFAEIVGGP
jgi:DNA-binding PadR family transcriptional regulator